MRATLDHIGIAVANAEEALRFYRDALGLEIEAPEEVPSQHVRAHFIATGGTALELLEATDAESPIAKYLARRGPGLHHITLRVDDIAAALAAESARRPADRRHPSARGAWIARRIHPPGKRPRGARGVEAGYVHVPTVARPIAIFDLRVAVGTSA